MALSKNLQQIINREVQPPNCDLTLGITLTEAENGRSQCAWHIEPKLANGNGVVMGGFITSAADIAIAYAVASLLNDQQSFTSISINTTFHRPVFEGEVTVIANVKKFGRTIAYVEAQLMQNDKVVADITSTVMILHNA